MRAEGKAAGKAPPQAGAASLRGVAAPTATRDARDSDGPTPSGGSRGPGGTAPDAAAGVLAGGNSSSQPAWLFPCKTQCLGRVSVSLGETEADV